MKRFFIVGFLVFLIGVTYAQEKVDNDKEESKNELSIFLGATSNSDATAFTLGVDYQHRFTKVVGLGGLVDYAMGDIQSVLIAPALYLHAWHFEFTVAPAAEFSDGDIVAVLRLGAAYEFEIKRFSISPSLFFDTERNESPAWVYGLSFGFEL